MNPSLHRRKSEEPGRLRAAVLRPLVWSLALLAGGTTILAGWLPWQPATGPRIGMGMFLLMLGTLVLAIPAGTWLLRRTTSAADYEGRCPVGESCRACGAFNLKPRHACRACGGPVN